MEEDKRSYMVKVGKDFWSRKNNSPLIAERKRKRSLAISKERERRLRSRKARLKRVFGESIESCAVCDHFFRKGEDIFDYVLGDKTESLCRVCHLLREKLLNPSSTQVESIDNFMVKEA